MIRLVEVPIRVVDPPRMEASDTAMYSLETVSRADRPKSAITGTSMATIGVLLRKALPTAVRGRSLAFASVSLFGWPMIRVINIEIAPVRYMPAATM